MADDDLQIAPVNMGQSMGVAAEMVLGLTMAFIGAGDSEEDKVTTTYICLAVFLHQLCCPAKHKDKMIGVLKAIIAELEESA